MAQLRALQTRTIGPFPHPAAALPQDQTATTVWVRKGVVYDDNDPVVSSAWQWLQSESNIVTLAVAAGAASAPLEPAKLTTAQIDSAMADADPAGAMAALGVVPGQAVEDITKGEMAAIGTSAGMVPAGGGGDASLSSVAGTFVDKAAATAAAGTIPAGESRVTVIDGKQAYWPVGGSDWVVTPDQPRSTQHLGSFATDALALAALNPTPIPGDFARVGGVEKEFNGVEFLPLASAPVHDIVFVDSAVTTAVDVSPGESYIALTDAAAVAFNFLDAVEGDCVWVGRAGANEVTVKADNGDPIRTLQGVSVALATLNRDGVRPLFVKRDALNTWIGQDSGVSVGAAAVVAPVAGTGYVHDQTTAATVWTVNHNLGFFPSTQVEDGTGTDVLGGDVAHVSVNSLTITFLTAQSGRSIHS